ncbi:MAG: hypothetical protein GY725_18595 [bacterium]|nr:hypothetical protein [bacterium]
MRVNLERYLDVLRALLFILWSHPRRLIMMLNREEAKIFMFEQISQLAEADSVSAASW